MTFLKVDMFKNFIGIVTIFDILRNTEHGIAVSWLNEHFSVASVKEAVKGGDVRPHNNCFYYVN